jgi:hypothetical protein
MKGRSIGIICLSIYLILVGLVLVFSLTFAGLALVEGVLALVAGVALLAGR